MSREEKELRKSASRMPSGFASDDAELNDVRSRRKLVKKRPQSNDSIPALVVETGPGFCGVLCSNQCVRCRSDANAAVGDRVLIALEKRRIVRVLPRRTSLSRPDPRNPNLERVIAANIDIIANVVSLRQPPLRTGLIDRYLIAIERSGAEPLVCVNKVDLLESASDLDALQPYAQMGVPVVLCSAATGAGLPELTNALRDKVCVFSGHSGVGKTSLLNALDPDLHLTTGDLSTATHTGRHTTTFSSLHRLPSGATIIDTPGIREFGLWSIQPADVRRYFRDLAQYAVSCAFSNCTHSHEQDCGVKQALADGLIPPARYSAYRRIVDSLV